MDEAPIDPPARSPRIVALDYLRGFFISIIVIDHLWRWPNLFQYVSGRGEMWVSAAEGFIIISGLLVGYVHGYKKRHTPMRPLASRLIRRGLMLYAWMVITTLALVSAIWLLDSRGATLHIPLEDRNWQQLLASAVSLEYVNSLTHFLYLYAIFLVISPLVLWLLRHRMAAVVIAASVLGWLVGIARETEWLQWQLLFFVPTVIGYYFDAILRGYRRLAPASRRLARWLPVAIWAVTFSLSLMAVLAVAPGEYYHELFTRRPLTLGTILLALVWFAGLLSLFHALVPRMPRWLRSLFLTFGERSLTGYILHIIPLIICQTLFAVTDNIIGNTLITALAVYMTWALMCMSGVNRVIPR